MDALTLFCRVTKSTSGQGTRIFCCRRHFADEMKPSPARNETETEESNTKKAEDVIFTKLRVVKNLVVLSIGSLFSFCAYDGLAVLQSTLNRENGIGVISLSIQNGCTSITALLFTKYFLKKFRCKSVISMTSVSFVVYAAANFYPRWYLLIPASIVVGLTNSLFWAAQCQYLNGLSILYADIQNKCNKAGQLQEQHTVQKQYRTQQDYGQREDCNWGNQGTYSHYDTFEKDNYVFQREEQDLKKRTYNGTDELHVKEFQTKESANQSSVFENAIHFLSIDPSTSNSKIFGKSHSVSLKIVTSNCEFEVVESTTSRMFGFHGFIYQTCHIWCNLLSYYVMASESTENDYTRNSTCMCGADFCNVETECFQQNLQEPNEQLKYILIGLFVAISMIAVLIVALFLDELKKKEETAFLTWKVLFASFRHMKNKFEILLAPNVMLVGVVQGFVMGDFTKAFIGCAWGIHHVGLVFAQLGAFLAISCTLSGWFVKHLGRAPIILIGQASIVAAGVLLLTWHPDAENTAMFFIVAGLFGVYIGILWSQLRAFYGVLFKEDEEVAFGNYNIFHCIGVSMAFGYSNFLCTSTKIYIFLAISIIGCIGYLLAEKSHSLSKSIK